MYRDTYPSFEVADTRSLDDVLLPLFSKSDAWSYEDEYRIIAQERANSTQHHTLMTENNLLTLPPDEEEAGAEKSGRK